MSSEVGAFYLIVLASDIANFGGGIGFGLKVDRMGSSTFQ